MKRVGLWSVVGLAGAVACGGSDAGRDDTGVIPGPTDTDDGTGEETDDEIFDIGGDGDGDGDPCEGGGDVKFSYIWVANSGEGTVSKINTMTLVEEGRYIVRPDSAGNPSRTSVNLSGDVAIANRLSGVAKVYAEAEDCAGPNTSASKDDVKPWGEDDCVAWYADFPEYNLMRPMAWAAGYSNPDTCDLTDERLWTTGAVSGSPGSVAAIRIDGADGQVLDTLPVPEVTVVNLGPYGGAVDSNRDFWFHQRDGTPFQLVHIDGDSLLYDIIAIPDPINPYGITVDSSDRIWIAGYMGGTGRYEPETGVWTVLPGTTGLGIQEDAEGRMFIAQYPWDTITGVHVIDVETVMVLDFIDMTGIAPESRGISIDFEGKVWMVDQTSAAYRIDPDSKAFSIYSGLNAPYTYSDMTGWGLNNVNPQG